MSGNGFRVTVEDLDTGEAHAMEVAAGDYLLIPFAPCHRHRVQRYQTAGTHVITIRGYAPARPARIVADARLPEPAVMPAEYHDPLADARLRVATYLHGGGTGDAGMQLTTTDFTGHVSTLRMPGPAAEEWLLAVLARLRAARRHAAAEPWGLAEEGLR